MDDDTIADLKQFIAATVRQETAGLATKDDIAALDSKLSAQLDTLQAAVADALDKSNDATHEQLQQHERWHHQTADKLGLKLDYQK